MAMDKSNKKGVYWINKRDTHCAIHLKDVSTEQFLHFVEKTGLSENMFQHKSHLTVCGMKSFLHISRVLWKNTQLVQKYSMSKPVVSDLVSQFLINLLVINHS